MSGGSGKLKVGVIGLGMGQRHVEAYARDERCEVAAMCDFSPEKLRETGGNYPGAALLSDANQLIDDVSLDVISIASFDDCHFEQTCRALRNGKHVYVEKPLCQTAEELKTISELWASHGGRVKLGCNLVLRSAPLYRWIKGEIASGAWGRIYSIDGEYLYGRLSKITSGWRSTMNAYSVMQGGGVHMMDLILWLTGERPADVCATGNRICTENTEFRYNDYVTSIMKTQSGMIARLTANFGCVHRHHHVMRIYGTEATFIHDDAGARLHKTRDPEARAVKVDLPALPAGKGDLIPGFITSIMEGGDTRRDFQMICDGISICIACDDAARTNQRETIKYV